jgi:hypothetical protein
MSLELLNIARLYKSKFTNHNMKKEAIILALISSLFILSLSIISANSSQEDSGLLSIGSGIDEGAENILKNEINIPSQIELPMRIAFGIKRDSPLTLEKLIIVLAIWATFFIVIKGLLKVAPFFNNGIENIIGSIIITMLIAVSGVIDTVVGILIGVEGTFEWMNSLGPFQFVIILILAILLIGLARYLTKKLEKNIVLTRATQTGEEIETMATMAKARLKN